VRDILVTLFVLGVLPLCFRRPFIGLLVFSVLAYMRIQDLTWGFARFQRWSFLVAIVMIAGWVAAREKYPPVRSIRTGLMAFLFVWVGLGHLFAYGDAPVDSGGLIEYGKIIFIALFTTAVVRTREQLRILVWVITMSFAFYGVKDGLHGFLTGGSVHIIRGPGGMIEDNNDFALVMAMTVPMLIHLATSERNARLTRGLKLMVPLTMFTVILTRSRGAFLALLVAISALVWRTRNRLIGLMFGLVAVGAIVAFSPSEFQERMGTIASYDEDGSAMGRIRAWKVALRMVDERPLFGVGFGRFQSSYLDFEPNPTPSQLDGQGTLVAHNSYLQIWAECGTPALVGYLLLFVASFIDIFRLRKAASRRYFASWILSYCTLFEAVLATFLVGSMFLNRAHFDLGYHLHAIVLVFGRVATKEMADEVRYPVRGSGGRSGPLVARKSSGFGTAAPSTPNGFRNTPLIEGA
jgi:putative inorganic carbon (HCO3(-)) transporter